MSLAVHGQGANRATEIGVGTKGQLASVGGATEGRVAGEGNRVQDRPRGRAVGGEVAAVEGERPHTDRAARDRTDRTHISSTEGQGIRVQSRRTVIGVCASEEQSSSRTVGEGDARTDPARDVRRNG